MGRKQRSTNPLYKTLHDKGANNFVMELLEETEVETKEQLRLLEQTWIEKLNPNLNTNKSVRVDQKAYSIEYYQDHKAEYKEYASKNRDAINERRRQKKQCPHCEKVMNGCYLLEHVKRFHS
jgi:hypothetical protein